MPTYLFSYIEYNTRTLITYVFLFFNIYTFLITIKKLFTMTIGLPSKGQ